MAWIKKGVKEFFGRGDELGIFSGNLKINPEDERFRNIFNIHGQGGIGKTWLTREFRKIADQEGAVTAYVDEGLKDIPDGLGKIVLQFKEAGYECKAFLQKYELYVDKKRELEMDPELAEVRAGKIGRNIGRLVTQAGKMIPVPGAEALFDYGADFLEERGDQWARAVHQKLKNPEQARLVLEPEGVLTPLFVSELVQIAREKLIVLHLDTHEYLRNLPYERAGKTLDDWLMRLIEGDFGALPAGLILVISGRNRLDENKWSEFQGLITDMPLEPFSELEAREYLKNKGITDERLVGEIWRFSRGIPLLVGILAKASPMEGDEIGDPCETIVERYLSWVKTPELRKLAQDAALARKLNRDVAAVIGGETRADEYFNWLVEEPSVERRGGRWAYHPVAREMFMRYKRQVSPRGWRKIHEDLAGYYEGLKTELGEETDELRREPAWQEHALEENYHLLCAGPQKNLARAINGFLAAWRVKVDFGQAWAKTIEQAGLDCEHQALKQWGKDLIDLLNAYREDRYPEAIRILKEVTDWRELEDKNRAYGLDMLGYVLLLNGQGDEGLVYLDEAIALAPEESEYLTDRGWIRISLDRYKEALADLDRAIELDEKNSRAFASRGETFRVMNQMQAALEDFNRAIKLDGSLAWAIAKRGETYRQMGKYKEALADFDRAIGLDEKDAWAIASRGGTYRQIGQYEAALADFNQAIGLDERDAWVFASRGETHLLMGHYEEALADLDQAVKLDGSLAWAIASRGETHRLMGKYKEALADFNLAIELNEKYAWAIAHRGEIYRVLKQYHAALEDLNRAIELDGSLAWAIARRGETHRLMGRYEAALADFNRAIKLNEKYAWAIARRGETHRLMGQYEAALADLDQTIKLDDKQDWRYYQRHLVYRLVGDNEKANGDLKQAIKLAGEEYYKNQEDWRNTFDLGLYYLAGSNLTEADRLFQEGCTGCKEPVYIFDAVYDLEELLTVIPEIDAAREWIRKLKKAEATRRT